MNLTGKRLVAVFAHPDDESLGPGGTIARYAAEGVEITLICATRGESGTLGHSSSYGPALLSRIRQAELEAAIEVLRIHDVRILGYPDRNVPSVRVERGIADVLTVLRQVEPDVVIAFHPSGISGHPDHKAMTSFATGAIEQLAAEADGRASDWRRRLRLHYYLLPASVARQITWRELPLVPDEEVTIEIDISPYAAVKRRAIHCHKTQLAFYNRIESMPGGGGRFSIEHFSTFGAPLGGRRANDLFG